MTTKVKKRDGSVVDFDFEKIEKAIIKAMSDSELGINEAEAKNIAVNIKERHKDEDIVDIETIQDEVEFALMIVRPEVAKAYILYREERSKLRAEGWHMTDLQRDIYEKKYRYDGESFQEFLERVSGHNSEISKAIKDKKFMPGGRILAGRGLAALGKKITLSNCYVLPKVGDSIESIYDTAKEMARTYSYGGGVGINISKLRPKGAKVNNAASSTSGSVSFMELYSMTTSLIGMKGRRGALMINMDVNHPDIEDFIDVKTDLDKVNSANISINITDDFMEAVRNKENFKLSFTVEPSGQVIEKTVDANKLLLKIAKNNWSMAEPGMLYIDRIDNWHLMSEDPDFAFAGVNPCAEEPLPAYGSCNLSSINLSEFVEKPFTEEASFNLGKFDKIVREGVRYLNDVLDENTDLHPLEEQKEVSSDLRQIGLGIMGLADALIKLKIRYGSDQSLELIDQIGQVLVNSALQESAQLAKEDGPFPAYKEEYVMASPFFKENANEETIRLVKEHGLRNSQVLTIAPTGSIATLIGCSNGIEPLFQISYTRKTESLYGEDTFYEVYADIVRQYMEVTGDEKLPDYIVTANQLDYRERIKVQAAFQKYIDASISSTVNVPNEFTVQEVEDLYIYAWEKGLKGVTIYRDGCQREGILTTTDTKKNRIQELQAQLNQEIVKELQADPDSCPMCGGTMNHSGGCSECQSCGYSPCAV